MSLQAGLWFNEPRWIFERHSWTTGDTGERPCHHRMQEIGLITRSDDGDIGDIGERSGVSPPVRCPCTGKPTRAARRGFSEEHGVTSDVRPSPGCAHVAALMQPMTRSPLPLCSPFVESLPKSAAYPPRCLGCNRLDVFQDSPTIRTYRTDRLAAVSNTEAAIERVILCTATQFVT
jgi:hypothetical protein